MGTEGDDNGCGDIFSAEQEGIFSNVGIDIFQTANALLFYL